MKKRLLSIAAILSLTMVASHAAVIASTDFSDTTKARGSTASQTMTNITWSGDDLVSVTPTTSVAYTGNPGDGYFVAGFGANGYAPDQNIENQGPWEATFELVFNGGATGSLTSISFDYAALNNDGDSQGNNFRPQNFDITVNGSAYEIQKQTTAVNGSLTFTDTAALTSGSNLILIKASEVNGAGYNMGIDDLVFNGDIIPEPSSVLLLGLGALGLLRRRRG